ncbi:molecular chaperone DnaK [Babesia caballi]|uniref:Molecular chaperone DnaK n=1 Tax=Babesia caballi TaxID=5871 RepID=A0AAV4M095_BABCB|nr:molecular chaperone DnaK [Babesia caballi]
MNSRRRAEGADASDVEEAVASIAGRRTRLFPHRAIEIVLDSLVAYSARGTSGCNRIGLQPAVNIGKGASRDLHLVARFEGYRTAQPVFDEFIPYELVGGFFDFGEPQCPEISNKLVARVN